MNININYRRLGWKRDKPDGRDFIWSPHPQGSGLPGSADLMAKMPFIYDQGHAGSCTSQMGARLWRYLHPDVEPSRLMIYYDTREIEGTADQDSGGDVRAGTALEAAGDEVDRRGDDHLEDPEVLRLGHEHRAGAGRAGQQGRTDLDDRPAAGIARDQPHERPDQRADQDDREGGGERRLAEDRHRGGLEDR